MTYSDLVLDETEAYRRVAEPTLKVCRELGYVGIEVVSHEEWPVDWVLLNKITVKGFEKETKELIEEILKATNSLGSCSFYFLVKGEYDLYLVANWNRYIPRILIPLGAVELSFKDKVFEKIQQLICVAGEDEYYGPYPIEQTVKNYLSAIKEEGLGFGAIYLKKGLREQYLSELMEAIEEEL
jgi:hypothetical protein